MLTIQKKRKAASSIGREGVSQMIQSYVNEYLKDASYKNAVKLAGQLHVMADACSFDEYWEEKMSIGKRKADNDLLRIIECKGRIENERQ